MIYLQKVFDDLVAGEYRLLDFGGGQGIIDDNSLPNIVSHINVGLTDLYSQFDIKFRTIQLALQPDQTEYYLTSANAVNGKKPVEPMFIVDTADNKFTDDIMKIVGVSTDSGTDLFVNSFQHKFSCHTPTFNRLQVPIQIVNKKEFLPENLKTDNLFIKYKAAHPVLDVNAGGFNPDKLLIELPLTHYNALLYFCASRATKPLSMNQQFSSGYLYGSLYEKEVARLKGNGEGDITDTGQVSKFRARGFV